MDGAAGAVGLGGVYERDDGEEDDRAGGTARGRGDLDVLFDGGAGIHRPMLDRHRVRVHHDRHGPGRPLDTHVHARACALFSLYIALVFKRACSSIF